MLIFNELLMYQLSKKLEQFALLILLIPIFIFGKLTKGNSRANILKRSQNNVKKVLCAFVRELFFRKFAFNYAAVIIYILIRVKNPVVFYMLRGGIKRCVSTMHLM